MANPRFEQLNDEQRKAVNIVDGPIMAVAGAGSGKTRVLTNRVAYLIEETGIAPDHILAITFTNKAANEMRERVHQLIGESGSLRGLWILTFHAMGARILRNEIGRLGYKQNFQILDSRDTEIITKNLLKEHNYDTKRFTPKEIADKIAYLKEDETLFRVYPEPVRGVLHQIYPAYCDYLKSNNLVDFKDLLVLPLKLLKEHPEVLKTYRNRFQYILVDEFQDTNNLQYDIVSLLAGKHRNLFIVGDEDQSIYAFRGSNIDNIKKFMKEFPEHKKIVLNQNYRSKTRILRAANDVISHNKKRIEKELYSELGEGEKLIHFKGENDEEEVYYVYNKIKQFSRQGIPYGEMVILYRNNAMSRKFEDLFIKYHIPYKVIGNLSFYKRKEIKDIIAYMRLLLNTGDDYAFTRIHNEPKRGVGEVSFAKIRDEANKRNVKMMDVIEPDMDFLSKRAAKRLNELKSAMTGIQSRLEEQNLLETYDEILDKSGYMAMLENDNHTEEQKIQAERRRENLQEFKTVLLERLRDYAAEVSNHEKLSDILNDLALREATQELTDDEDYISLMTMHSAKGLEFKIVFVTCLEQTLFPSSQSLFEKADVEEERRLFYVALTRAKDRVILTNARSRFMYGRYMHNKDSQFLGEIDDEHLERHGLAKERKSKTFNLRKSRRKRKKRKQPHIGYERSEKDLKLGDKVKHTTFGEGVVVDLSGRKVTVAFDKETGIKTLLKDHPSIEKVKS